MTMSDFDPSLYLTKISGQDYLPARGRIAWLRTVHPDATMLTELIEHSDGYALFRATVGIPGAGSATGWGSETFKDFPDYLEKAETKSIARALAHLGYGTLFAVDMDEGQRVADTPVPAKAKQQPTARELSGKPEPKAAAKPAAAAPVDANALEHLAAGAALNAAMQQHNWSGHDLINALAPVWPHVKRLPDLGTLTTPQLTLARGLVEDTHHVSHIDGPPRIVPGPKPIAEPADDERLSIDELAFEVVTTGAPS
jgi:hypothetical protein